MNIVFSAALPSYPVPTQMTRKEFESFYYKIGDIYEKN